MQFMIAATVMLQVRDRDHRLLSAELASNGPKC